MNKSSSNFMIDGVAEILQQVGKNIKIARMRRNITIQELANRVHVDERTISRLEKGDPSINFKNLVTVLITLGISDSVLNLAEVGVVVLMFQAGLETDIDELKKSGIPAFVIALCGVLIPLIMGAVLSVIYGNNIMESIFIGVILTATSVSITVEALQDMGHLKGRVGTAILGAAIIDDILGIVLLSIMTSLGGASGFHIQAILKILIQMAAFFAISIIGGVGIKKFFEWLSTYKNPEIERHRRRVPVFALAFCLALAFLAEVFGIADITGAYLAGIILCRLPERFYIYNKIEVLSYMLITPVFFASIIV